MDKVLLKLYIAMNLGTEDISEDIESRSLSSSFNGELREIKKEESLLADSVYLRLSNFLKL